jgi:hypothetical protein
VTVGVSMVLYLLGRAVAKGGGFELPRATMSRPHSGRLGLCANSIFFSKFRLRRLQVDDLATCDATETVKKYPPQAEKLQKSENCPGVWTLWPAAHSPPRARGGGTVASGATFFGSWGDLIVETCQPEEKKARGPAHKYCGMLLSMRQLDSGRPHF